MISLLSPNNQLFQLARSGRRLPHIILAVVLSVLFILIAQLTGGVLAVILVLFLSVVNGQVTWEALAATLSSGQPEAVTAHILPDTALEQTLFLILLFLPIFLIIWVWLALFEKRPLWTIGLERVGGWQKYLRGLLVGLAMFGASIGISAALGYISLESVSSQPQGLAALGGVLLVFLGWTVQGPAEEALTRGWLLPVIGARYKPLWGVVVSSFVFAAFHSLNFIGLAMDPIFVGLALLNLFLFGLFAALYALYEESMWGVFSIHAVWNWAQGNIFGFEVSGGAAPGGTLFNLMEVGPDVITGGPFGPEGGLAVTIVLIISCGIIWRLDQRRKDTERDRLLTISS